VTPFAQSDTSQPCPNATKSTCPGHILQPRFASLELLAPFIPEADPEHPGTKAIRVGSSQQDGVLIHAFITATSVFFINIIGTVILVKEHDSGVMYHGNCQKVSNLSTSIHVLINILSSLLLGASNFCMQLLAAPKRDEIDKAHLQSMWLDIGVPSLRNIPHIAWARRLTWMILGLSSLPLHFL
jgi:hypothetical protein